MRCNRINPLLSIGLQYIKFANEEECIKLLKSSEDFDILHKLKIKKGGILTA